MVVVVVGGATKADSGGGMEARDGNSLKGRATPSRPARLRPAQLRPARAARKAPHVAGRFAGRRPPGQELLAAGWPASAGAGPGYDWTPLCR